MKLFNSTFSLRSDLLVLRQTSVTFVRANDPVSLMWDTVKPVKIVKEIIITVTCSSISIFTMMDSVFATKSGKKRFVDFFLGDFVESQLTSWIWCCWLSRGLFENRGCSCYCFSYWLKESFFARQKNIKSTWHSGILHLFMHLSWIALHSGIEHLL